MENYFKLLMVKKDNVRALILKLEKLENEARDVSKELLSTQASYTRVYHEIKNLMLENEKNNIANCAMLLDILIFLLMVFLLAFLKEIGLDIIKLLLIALSSTVGVGLVTMITVNFKMQKYAKLATNNKVQTSQKEEELKDLESKKILLGEKLILINREVNKIRTEIAAENISISKLESLIDKYLAPFLSSQVDEAIESQNVEANMALTRIAKHLNEE